LYSCIEMLAASTRAKAVPNELRMTSRRARLADGTA